MSSSFIGSQYGRAGASSGSTTVMVEESMNDFDSSILRKKYSSSQPAETLSLLAKETSNSEKLNARAGFQLLDDALEDIGVGKFQRNMMIVSSFGQFVDAAEVSMLAMLYPQLESSWGIGETQIAMIGSFTAMGMMLGAMLFGKLSDSYGRRISYQLSLILCAGFGFLSSYAGGVYVFSVLRFFLGLGYGGNLVASTTLLIEYIPNDKRGLFMGISGLAFGIGSISIVGIAWGLHGLVSWRWLIRIAALLAVPVICALSFVPESSRFYVMQGRNEEAVKCIANVARVNGKPMPKYFSVEALDAAHSRRVHQRAKYVAGGGGSGSFQQDSSSTKLKKKKKKWFESEKKIWNQKTLRTFAPLFMVWFFNSFAGSIFSWIPLELRKDFTNQENATFQIAFVLGVGQLIGCFVTSFMVIKVKRITLMKLGTFLCCAFTLLLGVTKNHSFLYFTAIGLQISSSLTIFALYLYSPEVFPTSIRVTAFGLLMLGHRMAPALSPFVIAALDKRSFQLTCFVYSGIYLLAGAFAAMLTVSTFNAPLVEEEDQNMDARYTAKVEDDCEEITIV